jgi:pilus assembly protein Flp/PilA
MGKRHLGKSLHFGKKTFVPLSFAGTRFWEEPVIKFLHQLWSDDSGQDIAEYAVMLAVILVIVVGTIRLIGSNANTVFSQVGSAIQ